MRIRLADLRVLDFVGSLQEGDHLVFTHAGVIRVLLRHAGSDAHVEPGGLACIERDPAATFVSVLQVPRDRRRVRL